MVRLTPQGDTYRVGNTGNKSRQRASQPCDDISGPSGAQEIAYYSIQYKPQSRGVGDRGHDPVNRFPAGLTYKPKGPAHHFTAAASCDRRLGTRAKLKSDRGDEFPVA